MRDIGAVSTDVNYTWNRRDSVINMTEKYKSERVMQPDLDTGVPNDIYRVGEIPTAPALPVVNSTSTSVAEPEWVLEVSEDNLANRLKCFFRR